MKRKLLLPALLAAAGLAASAGVNSPGNNGDILCAGLMLENKNYTGCIDRLDAVDASLLSPAEAESLAWMRARATAHLDRSQAIALLRAFISGYPASELRPYARMLLADCLLATEPAQALKLYESVDRGSLPADRLPELDYHTAYAYLQLGELDKARSLFASARRGDAWRDLSDFYLGYIAYSRHEYAEARRLLERADRSQLPGSMADYYLAQISYVEGDYDKALASATALLARGDTDSQYTAEANRIAGESLFQKGREAEGLPYLRRYAEEAEAPERSTMYILGTAEYRGGRYAEAVAALEPVASQTDAMGQSAYLYIGQALMQQGDRDAAIIAFDKAMHADFDTQVQEAAWYNYAVARMQGAREPFGSSVATFEEFLRRYPNGRYAAAVQEYLVDGYLTDHNYEAALQSIGRMANPGPKVMAAKQQVLYALGTRALAADSPEAALKYLTEARTLARHNSATAAAVNLSLGEAYYKTGDFGRSAGCIESYLSEAPASDTNRPLALYDLGYARFAAREYADAARAFEQFAARPGRLGAEVTTDALNRLGDCKLYTGDFDAARTYFDRAYDAAPASGDYPLYRLAQIEGYRRDHKAKIATVKRLLAEYPTSSLVPDALLEMTESYIQLGKNKDAIDTYRRLVSDYPTTEQGRRGYLQMALTLLNTGARADAIEAYRQVVTLFPTSEEARMAVDELKRIAADDGTLPEFSRWLAGIADAPVLDVAETDRLTFEAAEKAWLTRGDTSRLERYLTDNPAGASRLQALTYLMEDADRNGRTNDALTFATEIVTKYPDARAVEQALQVKAAAEHSLGRGHDALRTWSDLAARASTPQTINDARAGIMRVARDLGDQPKVLAAAEALLASSAPGSEIRNEAAFSRGLALEQTGRTAEARRQWAELADNTDDLYGAKSAYYLAQSYMDGGERAEARRRTEAIIDSATPHTYWLARAFILLSDIYAADGKTFEAREYLTSLRKNYPGDEADIFRLIDAKLSELPKK